MTGQFVQVNTESRFARSQPIGYVIDPSGCWLWTGSLNKDGYGKMDVAGSKPRRRIMAHRWMYELHKGRIRRGLEIDHLCRRPNCVNPDHLEPVRHRINVKRGRLVEANEQRGRERTHCRRGHPLTGLSADVWIDLDGWKRCRVCKRDAYQHWYDRHKRKATKNVGTT